MVLCDVVTTTAALIALYLILAAFFAALLTIATTIRDKGDTVGPIVSQCQMHISVLESRSS